MRQSPDAPAVLLATVTVLVGGWGLLCFPVRSTPSRGQLPGPTPVTASNLPAARELHLTPIEDATISHLIWVADGLFSGGEPEGPEAFERLRQLDVTTIISVDGKPPAVDAARKFGMKYVHVPIGYDGIPLTAQATLAEVMRQATAAGETVYVHCHHGRHRGPAAAGICGQAAGLLTQADGQHLLELAATGPDYVGLWRDVAGFDKAQLPAPGPLLESVDPEPLVERMLRIEELMGHLSKLDTQRADRAAATSTALLLKEEFKETRRMLPADSDADLVQQMVAALHSASGLEELLRAPPMNPEREPEAAPGAVTGLPAGFLEQVRAIQGHCVNCHQAHRS